MIEIALDSDAVMTGHFVSAHVRWRVDQERPARRIIVSAQWDAEAFNGKVRGVGRSMQHVPRGNERQGAFPVRLLIPHEGPTSFQGEVITIAWNLWAHLDHPSHNEFAHALFRVTPRHHAATV